MKPIDKQQSYCSCTCVCGGYPACNNACGGDMGLYRGLYADFYFESKCTSDASVKSNIQATNRAVGSC